MQSDEVVGKELSSLDEFHFTIYFFRHMGRDMLEIEISELVGSYDVGLFVIGSDILRISLANSARGISYLDRSTPIIEDLQLSCGFYPSMATPGRIL